jgi:ribosomal-protein-alanine N-acetyltransferase
MAGINIRRMTLQDIETAARIEAETFPRPWTLADFRFEMSENPVARYLVAQREGEIIGFAGAHIILDEGHITNIAVLREARGQGLGRLLMEGLMQYASNLGVRYMTLEVRVSNVAAVALYRSLGFIKVNLRQKYYEDNGEDAWLMVCDQFPEASADFLETETLRE